MLAVTLICVGKMKERHYLDAFAEYEKRLGAYCRFALVEIPEQRLSDEPGEREIAAALEKEAVQVEKHIPAGSTVVAMCVEGQQLSSQDLARQLTAWANGGCSRLCFLVGGSFGLSEGLKARADLRLSVSKMTFPHHLFRVMLAEQLYRSFTILAGSRYHK